MAEDKALWDVPNKPSLYKKGKFRKRAEKGADYGFAPYKGDREKAVEDMQRRYKVDASIDANSKRSRQKLTHKKSPKRKISGTK